MKRNTKRRLALYGSAAVVAIVNEASRLLSYCSSGGPADSGCW